MKPVFAFSHLAKVASSSPTNLRSITAVPASPWACAKFAIPSALCIVSLACAVAAHAQSTYRDPAGNFTIMVPQGWTTEPQENNGISVVNEKLKSSVSVFVMRGPDSSTPSPKQELDGVRGQLQNCPSGDMKTGDSTLLGMRGMYLLAKCSDKDIGELALKFVVLAGPGVMVVVNTAAPTANLVSAVPTLSAIERSIKVTNGSASSQRPLLHGPEATSETSDNSRQLAALQRACSSQALTKEECDQRIAAMNSQPQQFQHQWVQDSQQQQPPQQPQSDQQSGQTTSNDPNWTPGGGGGGGARASSGVFRDNQGRYSLTIPQGWSAQTANDNSGALQLSRGQAWATVTWVQGTGDDSSRPAQITHAILQDMQSQYQDAKLLGEGDFQSNGHPAHGANASGVDSHGVRVSVAVITVQVSGMNFLSIVCSNPDSESEQVSNQIKKMLDSVRFGGE